MSYENIIKNTSDYHAGLLESLKDKDEAIAYLKVALEEYEEDHDTEIFMLALRNVAEARGGIDKLSEETKLNIEDLYRILSKHSKSFYFRETIKHYLEDMEDYYLGMEVLKKPGQIYSLDEVRKICELDD